MITVTHLMSQNADPSDADIRSALSSNLCRCTGYNQMYQAVRAAIEAEKKGIVAVSSIRQPVGAHD
jgi:carbon-monoxide dehydrogenase small subunit